MNTLNASGLVSLFAQQGNNDAAGGALGLACCGPVFLAFGLMIFVLFAIQWKIFTKAGQPGWAALVPFYNQWILVTEICKKEPLWFILFFVPIGNIVAAWVVCMELAKKFGKTETFGIGLFFLSPIFMAILAFGDAEYQGGRKKKRSSDVDEDDNW
ncbi:hypothetical protein VT84_33985 [Gemmata sp. SH-PL17]|uniref:DUF5684 domain-containing protein n=1 Tax=Gemmata sp. SH-PL17 TaxID=1630693 RepID=UPI00078D5F5A|nr:DUF5684 domain-containing protein [Gemmata sp. SH-PL17]AMV29454.1 hypothetical protein VT84_33985 [Gemmata sp. SH-PL17]